MDESDFGGLQNRSLAILLPPSRPNSPSDGSTTAAPLCSRLERSPWQRAVAEGFLVPKEGCLTVRIILHHLVRAVLRVWQTAAHGLAGRPSHSR